MKTLPDQFGILQLISEGNERAYSIFFDHYYTLLWPFVYKFTKSEPDTEEVLQDTMVRVWLYRDKILEIENINAWIYKVASRECLSFLRKNLSSRQNETELDNFQDFTDNRSQNPFDRMNFQQVNALVKEAIENLSPQRKKIYLLSRDEGLKPSEIAENLSLSVSTVKNVLSTSLKEIRSYLSASGYDLAITVLFWIKFVYLSNFQ